MLQIRQPDIIPARVRHAAPITGIVLVDCAGEVRPCEAVHDDAAVVGAAGDGAGRRLRLVGALVNVALGDEDGECDVVGFDVAPGDVLGHTLAADPGLPARSVDAVYADDVVEEHVGDIGVGGLVLAQTPDGHAM